MSGEGRVNTWTVNYHPWLPDMKVPFVFAAIELVEQSGLLVMSNIVNCAADDVRIGMNVCVHFEQHDEIWIPLFEPMR